MADNPRIEDLRRRIRKDPASIAFAQLAEELRRAGESREAADICRAGLAVHPSYLSARVTLGRALLELGELDVAQEELERVLVSAPENLAAIRGLAEIHHSQGALSDALKYYRSALALARNDTELQHTVDALSAQVDEKPRTEAHEGLALEQIEREFLDIAPPPESPAVSVPAADLASETARAQIAALEQFAEAIHVARAQRRA